MRPRFRSALIPFSARTRSCSSSIVDARECGVGITTAPLVPLEVMADDDDDDDVGDVDVEDEEDEDDEHGATSTTTCDDEDEGEGEDSDGEDDTTGVLGGMMLGTRMSGKPAAAEIDAPPKVAVLVGRYSAKAGATAVEEPDVGEELRSGVASAVGEPVDGTPRGLALRRIVVSAEGDGGETNNDTGLPLASSARRMRSPITGHRIDSTARCAGTCLLSM